MTRMSFRFAAIAATVLVAGAVAADVTVNDRLADGQPPLVGAWRASGGGFPESTLAGIRYSLERGTDILDFHVQLTGDGQHVVYHHARLDHMTDVATVFPDGPPGGPKREDRGGLDYTRDYTLADIRQLRLVIDGQPTEHAIPTLEEALDLVDGQQLVNLALQEFDLNGLADLLADRPTRHLLVSSVDPQVVKEVASATGAAGYAIVTQSRLFETTETLAILDATAEIVGDDLVLAHVRRASRVTPELLARANALGVRLSVSGYGKEDMALADNADPSVWLETLESGALVYWTTEPDALLNALGR